MSKGKKYTAAEKYFFGKMDVLRKEIKSYKVRCRELYEEIHDLREEKDKLSQENAEMGEHLNKLLEYTKLNKEDIISACQHDKDMGQLLKLIKGFSKMLNYRGM